MEKLFKEPELQKKFDDTKLLFEQVRLAVSAQVDLNNPISVLDKLNLIANIQGTAAECKARFQLLLERHTLSKLAITDNYNGSAAEKKAILNAEVAGVSFYDTWAELVIKEMHYRIEILRTSLSYLKSETLNLK
jgi:hypothetical protein